MQVVINGVLIQLTHGDITDLTVDALVNSANPQLILGEGVSGAILRKGGPLIQEECLAIGYCEVGEAVITTAGQLNANYVIHAVGPRMGEGSASGKLANAVRASLRLAEEHGLASVAFPAISTGVYGYPLEGCADVMLRVIVDYTFEDLHALDHVVVCLFDERALAIFQAELERKLQELADE